MVTVPPPAGSAPSNWITAPADASPPPEPVPVPVRPPAVQFVASVTSFAVSHWLEPALYADRAAVTVLSGGIELLYRAALKTSWDFHFPANAAVGARESAIHWRNTADADHAIRQPPLAASRRRCWPCRPG